MESCVFTDSDFGVATRVRNTVSRCFAALRQLENRHLRRCRRDNCFLVPVVVPLLHSRLDFDPNFTLVGLPAYLLRQLQSALNAAVCSQLQTAALSADWS